ncbi:hypothetical protein I3271_05520 [Photobacterium leiognathi]|uniref:hypothetical protein n=1 Tax=Photobacterium leiognathi TaxID=553611 RepID=UPI001EDEEBB3|nr:hypothetical protein [Photobacterium leiognathi]MCG3884140.1 hypothetical protein [Photobacterium leiognathi]
MSKQDLIHGILNKETFQDFVERLTVEQSGNRPHATANPIFSVQNQVINWGVEDGYHDVKAIYWCLHGESFDSYRDFISALDDDADREQLERYVESESVDTSDLDDVVNAINAVFEDESVAFVTYGKYVWEHVNTHLTPEAAHAFIERKKHDYRKLRVYAESSYWCWELKAILDGLVNGSIQYVEQSKQHQYTDTKGWKKNPEHTITYRQYTYNYDTAYELGVFVFESGSGMPNPFEPDFTEYDDFNEGFWAAKDKASKQ